VDKCFYPNILQPCCFVSGPNDVGTKLIADKFLCGVKGAEQYDICSLYYKYFAAMLL
jgi:hypothetical protein